MTRVLCALILVFLTGCNIKTCTSTPGGKAEITVKMGKLSDDPLTAARELGAASATEKDEDVLEGKLLAFLERVGVPVFSRKGDEMLTKAPASKPLTGPFFWEPVVAGLARGTTKGTTMPLTAYAKMTARKLDLKKMPPLDFAKMFTRLAEIHAKKKTGSSNAMIATAIAENLKQRKEVHADPRVDPVTGALFMLWLQLAKKQLDSMPRAPSAPSALPPGMPSNIPGLPPGLKIPGVRNDLSRAVRSEVPFICTIFDKAFEVASGYKTLAGFVEKALDAIPEEMLTATEASILPELKYLGEALEAIEITVQAIAGIAIALFLDVDENGTVTPDKIKYGDPPATFSVKARSVNPLDKDEMHTFVSCMKTLVGRFGFLLDDLEQIPPKGEANGLPVIFTSYDQFDPRDGKFKADSSAQPEIARILGVAQQVGMDIPGADGIAIMQGGVAQAKFEVKKNGGKMKVYRRFVVHAHVLPFPLTSVLYTVNNILWGPDVPLAIEIEAHIPANWTMKIKQDALATAPGLSGGWKVGLEGTIPFRIDSSGAKSIPLEGKGEGQWTFLFEGTSNNQPVVCKAAPQTNKLSYSLKGEVAWETFDAAFELDVRGPGKVDNVLDCKNPQTGIKVAPPMKAPIGPGNLAVGSPLSKFTMSLVGDLERVFPIGANAGLASSSGTLTVTLIPGDE